MKLRYRYIITFFCLTENAAKLLEKFLSEKHLLIP